MTKSISAKYLGVNGAEERQKEDYYATDPNAVKDLVRKLQEHNITIPHTIVESSVGGGSIANVFKNNGHKVIAYDIKDRGYADTTITDYLFVGKLPTDDDVMIVENPPYKLSLEFIQHGLSLIKDGNYLCSLQKIQFLESERRKPFFESTPPKYVFVFSKRCMTYRDGQFEKYKSSMMCYAWFVWEKGYKGDTILKWI